MKKIILILAFSILSISNIFAQVPDAIDFQAIARNEDGTLMSNTNIQIRLTIVEGSTTGTEIYQELHSVTTDNYGNFSFKIGREASFVTVGNFNEIEWENGKKYLKIDYDPSNNFDWSLSLGTIELVSVPYAFAAGAVTFIDMKNAKEGDVLVFNSETQKFEAKEFNSNSDWNLIENKPENIDENKNDDVTLNDNQTIEGDKIFTKIITAQKGLDAQNNTISNLSNPTKEQDAATKKYVDDLRKLIYQVAPVDRLLAADISVAELLEVNVSAKDLFDAGIGVGTLEQHEVSNKKLEEAELIGKITDIDGNTYNWVKIGNQTWMRENLRTTRYANGTALIYGKNLDDISNDFSSKYYFALNNDTTNLRNNGYLYTWAAATNTVSNWGNDYQKQGVCPSGWHVPTNAEWLELASNLEGKAVAGGKLKEKSLINWKAPNTDASNASGFTALPVPYRPANNQNIAKFGYGTNFWTGASKNKEKAWYIHISYSSGRFFGGSQNKADAAPVRCVKNK